MTGSDDDRILRESLASALESIGQDTGEAIAALKRRERTARRVLRWLIALTAAMAVTLGIVITTVIGASHTAKDVQDVQDRTSDRVLCPLYGLLIAAGQRPPPPDVDTPEELRQRERNFEIIREGAATLGCFKDGDGTTTR